MSIDYSAKGRGHVRDGDSDQDKKINMAQLEHSVDVETITSIDLFSDKFKFADGEERSYQNFGIYDQDEVGSCTSNAVAAAYRYMLQRHGLHDFQPSRLFLYYLARTPDETIKKAGFEVDMRGSYYESLKLNPPTLAIREDSGSKIRENVRILARLGVPSEAEWPYSIDSKADEKDKFPEASNVARCPTPETLFTSIKKQIEFHYVRPMVGDGSLKCWKQCIANGYPILCGIDEFDGFQKATTTETFRAVTPAKDTKYITGHTVLVVGWNDEKEDGDGHNGCFKVQNSWGKNDKWDGFFWMPYTWLTTESPHIDEYDDDDKPKPNKMAYSPWVLVDREDLVKGVH
jgi:C1A family cysteine protease